MTDPQKQIWEYAEQQRYGQSTLQQQLLAAMASGASESAKVNPEQFVQDSLTNQRQYASDYLNAAVQSGQQAISDIIDTEPDVDAITGFIEAEQELRRISTISEGDATLLKVMESEPPSDTQDYLNAEALQAATTAGSGAERVQNAAYSLLASRNLSSELLDQMAGGVVTVAEAAFDPVSIKSGIILSNTLRELGVEPETRAGVVPSPGKMIEQFRNLVNAAGPEEGDAIAKVLLKNVQKTVEFGTETTPELVFTLDTILGPDFDTRAEAWPVLTDVFATLEAIPIVGIAAKGIKKVLSSSTMGKLMRMAPKQGKAVAEKIVKEGDPAQQRAAGASIQQIVNDAELPKPVTEGTLPKVVGPDLNPVAVSSMARTPADLLQGQVTDAIRAGAVRRIEDAVINNAGALHPSKGVAAFSFKAGSRDEVVDYTVTFGDSDTKGFGTLGDALMVKDRFLINNPKAEVTIMTRDLQGNLRPFGINFNQLSKESLDTLGQFKGEYFVSARQTRFYNLDDYSDLDKDYVGTVSVLRKLFGTEQAGVRQKNFRNSFVALAASRAREVTQIDKKLIDLPKKDLNKLEAYLNNLGQGSDRLRTLPSDTELVERFGFSKKAIEGLKLYRVRDKKVFEMQQEGVYSALWAAGYKGLKLADQTVAAVRVTSPPADLRKVVFPDKTVQDFTPEIRDGLSSGKMYLYRMWRPFEDATGEYNYAIAKSSRDIDDLPLDLIDYIPDYLPRIYDATHFVVRPGSKLVDGTTKADEEVIAASIGRADAAAWVAKHGGEIREAKELGLVDNQFALSDIESQASRMVAKATRADKPLALLGDLNINVNLYDAMGITKGLAQRSVGVQRAVLSNILDYNRTFGKTYGKFQYGEDLKPRPGINENSAEFKRARALHDYINYVNGSHPRQIQEWAENTAYTVGDGMILLGESINGKVFSGTLKRSGMSLQKRGLGQTLSPIRRLGFDLYIAQRPLRQLLIQPSSTLLLMPHKPAYFFGAFVPEFLGLVGAKAGGKLSGKNFDMLSLEQFEKSGLSELITQNQLLHSSSMTARDLVQSPKAILKAGGLSARNAYEAANASLKNMGFVTAEWANKAAGFLVARREFMDESGKLAKDLTDDDILRIAARAETMMQNMNAAGTLGTQHGALGTLMQFTSFALKTTMLIMPRFNSKFNWLDEAGKIGSDTLTNKQKATLVAFGSLLFGLEGYGDAVNNAYTKIKEETGFTPDPAVDLAIRNGLTAAILNGIDQDAYIQTKDVSPFGGSADYLSAPVVVPYKIFETFVNGDVSVSALGRILDPLVPVPGATVSESFLGGIGGFMAVTFGNPANFFEGEEQVRATVRSVLRISPMMSDIERALAGDALHTLYSKSGNPVAKASVLEAWSKVAGIRSLKEDNLYKAMDSLRGPMTAEGPGGKMGAIQRVAEDHAADIMAGFRMTHLKQMTFPEFYDRVLARVGLVRYALNSSPEEDRIYQEALNNSLRAAFERDSSTDRFVESVWNAHARDQMGGHDNLVSVINALPPSEFRSKMLMMLGVQEYIPEYK